MVCLSLSFAGRRQHAANHGKGFTTTNGREGVCAAQDAVKSGRKADKGSGISPRCPIAFLVKDRVMWCNSLGECHILQTPLAALVKMDAGAEAKTGKK
jgi:hypothetical protein